jgi:hypothetical protein
MDDNNSYEGCDYEFAKFENCDYYCVIIKKNDKLIIVYEGDIMECIDFVDKNRMYFVKGLKDSKMENYENPDDIYIV